MLEIRWHGRGGQGAKTAAFLLGEALAATGKYVQAFPEYGPERSGAPVVAYNRVADEPIRLHCSVLRPRYVVVLDPSLIGPVNPAAGVPDDGVILVNTSLGPQSLRERLELDGRLVRVVAVDANRIAVATLGRAIPNTPMLGALVAVARLLSKDLLLETMRHHLTYKFRGRRHLVDPNLAAIQQAYEEVAGR